MKSFCFILLLLTLSPDIMAGTLTGRVFDHETNQVIRDVNIRILETGAVTSTSNHGIYTFDKIPDGSYRLIASHVSYDISDTLSVVVSGEATFDINLHPSPWVLNEVVVTGTRTPHLLKDVPVQTEVISQRDFERTGATTVDEALASSIGINISQGLSGTEATIRGIQQDRVLVMVDGERAVGRVNAAIDLSQFALNNVEKIEIVKGTGSTLYGSDAMGGVINIITKNPTGAQRNMRAYFDYGSHKTYNPSLSGKFGGAKTGLLLTADYFATDGFDLDESTPHTNGQDAVKRLNLSSKVKHALSPKWSVTNALRFMHEKREWIESEEYPTFTLAFDDAETNKRYESSLVFDYLSGDKYSMKFRLFGTYYDHDWTKHTQTTGEWVDTSETEDIFWEASYTSNYSIGQDHIATYGLDYNFQDLTSDEIIEDKEADKSAAGYLQYEYTPFKKLSVVSGLRYEHHSSFGDHLNPSINLMYSPTNNLKFRTFYGRGFRAPSIKQQYFIFDHTAAGYIVYGGSVDLPPEIGVAGPTEKLNQETSKNFSVSAELSYGTIGLHRITYYHNKLDDLIEFVLLKFTPTYWRGVYVYKNIDQAETKGIEWESRVRLTKSLDFSFAYTYLYSRNLNTDEKLVNRPDHTLNFFLTYFNDNINLGFSFYGTYQSKKLWVPRSNTGGNEGDAEYAPERTVLNFNLFKRFNNDMEIFTRFENITDEVNITYGYWPGFSVYFGIKKDINF